MASILLYFTKPYACQTQQIYTVVFATATRHLFLVAVLFAIFAPLSSAHAAVVFSEIAWMGTTASANDEWIELFNSGESAVLLDGYTVKDGASLEVGLTGTIQAGAHAVLERTDDDTAPGSALVVYTGALPNTGAVLSLYRPDGSLEDQIAGGENWENIGGDNTTKETAQKTEGGWKTAAPTPGHGGEDTSPPQHETKKEEEKQTQEPTKNNTDDAKNETIELQLPNTELSLEVVAPEIAYVNQNVVFEAEATGIGKTAINSLTHSWNFGDFSIQKGKQVRHRFAYAGEYVVTVHASFGRHEQVARKTITILPVQFSLSHNSFGDLVVHNNAKYEVNVSGFKLQGADAITFPQRSVILANATIIVPKEKMGGPFVRSTLFDQQGIMVASSLAEVHKTPAVREESALPQTISIPDVARSSVSEVATTSNFMFVDEVSIGHSSDTEEPAQQLALLPESSQQQPGNIPEGTLPLLALIGIVTVGITAVFLGKKQ